MLTRLLFLLLLVTLNLHAQQLPQPDHIVVVIEENKNFEDIIDPPNTPAAASRAPYLNGLLPHAALLTKSYGLHHPSQPNYLELFSGSQQGICNDTCPTTRSINAPNLAASLIDAHKTQPAPDVFTGYAEHLPTQHNDCNIKPIYGRKHCPWMDFRNVPASMTKDFSAFPTTTAGFDRLPRVAFVIPDLTHDMHNLKTGLLNTATEVREGSAWLQEHLDAYAQWAIAHNSLLIITWDEDNALPVFVKDDCEHPITTLPPHNRIATIILGAHVIPGSTSAMPVTHYNVLRTIEDMEGLSPIGASCSTPPITGIWK